MSEFQPTQKIEPVASGLPTKPARDPLARIRATDLYWIQLKAIYKGRLIAQPERLAKVTVYQDKAGHLEIYRLHVQLEEETLAEGSNHLDVLIDHRNRRVRFAPVNTLRIQPAQRGIGGFLLAQLVEWCQRHYSDYAVTPIVLQADEAVNDEGRHIRDKMLSRAGFELSLPEDAAAAGHARVGRVDDLISQWNTERVGVLHVTSLLKQLRDQELLNNKQSAQMAQLQRTIDQYRSNDTGQRFAIGCLIVFAVFQALMLLWIVLS
tara:strand:+ start:2161 stop:2952 length:792 start_codon:yes stop_codon:yes gene_type:complete